MPIFAQYDPDVDIETLNETRIDDLIDREPDIAVRLEACRHEEPHEDLVCAVCSEASRIPYINELLRVADEYEGPHRVATVYLTSVPTGELASVDLSLVKDAFRTRLRRCGFSGSFLGGGIEAAWFHRPDVWIVHSHLLAIGALTEAWGKLDDTLRASGARNPVQVVRLRNAERQNLVPPEVHDLSEAISLWGSRQSTNRAAASR